MNQLGGQGAPFFDRGGPEDQDEHDDGAGDGGGFGEESQQQQGADDKLCKGQGIAKGLDQGPGEDGLLEGSGHSFGESGQLGDADEAMTEET